MRPCFPFQGRIRSVEARCRLSTSNIEEMDSGQIENILYRDGFSVIVEQSISYQHVQHCFFLLLNKG